MSGIWGNNIRLSIFGESHGAAIGITIDGLEPGFELDLNQIYFEMARRAPGNSELSTPRKESDQVQILSGFFNGKTTGTPLCAMIANNNMRSMDYEKSSKMLRPSHADYTGIVKYNGFNDYRGGGHFSGRLTAPIVFAGAVCRQVLSKSGIIIGSHIKSIGRVEGMGMDLMNVSVSELMQLHNSEFPVIDLEAGSRMKETILKAKEAKDSVGGVVECAVVNLPVGIGDPFFDSLESRLSHLLFSIPGVKGVEFGDGFQISSMTGSEANDSYYMDGENIKINSNHNGGILGGISNGMPLVFRVAIKPTPSIGRMQKTVNIEERKDAELKIIGRHDPCIVPRALPVVEAVAAIAILDLMGNI